MNYFKALIGDYIQLDGSVSRVTSINRISDSEVEYLLDNGQVVSENDFSYEDVLLESEVCVG